MGLRDYVNWALHMDRRNPTEDPTMASVPRPNPAWRPSSPPFQLEEPHDGKFVLVHVWARWNGYDRRMDTILSQIDWPAISMDVVRRSLDADDELFRLHLREWGVLNLPALVALVNGNKVAAHIGLAEPRTIQAWIEQHAARAQDHEG